MSIWYFGMKGWEVKHYKWLGYPGGQMYLGCRLFIHDTMDELCVFICALMHDCAMRLNHWGFFQRHWMKLWIYSQNIIVCTARSLSLTVIFSFSVSRHSDGTNKLQNKVGQKIWLAGRANRDTAPNQCYLLSIHHASFGSCGKDDQRAVEGRRQRGKRERKRRRRG